MNETPRISDPTNGIFRRIHIIEIPALPENERDVSLKEAFKKEGPGILNWCLEGLDRLNKRGHFNKPDAVIRTTKEYRDHSDVPGLFLTECCERDAALETSDSKYRVQASDLYTAYSGWAKQNGHRPVSSTRLAEDWRRLRLTRKAIGGLHYWYGIRLNEYGETILEQEKAKRERRV